eukprot:1124263-Rhodomonas_salina.1
MPRKGGPQQIKGAELQEQKRRERALKKEQTDALKSREAQCEQKQPQTAHQPAHYPHAGVSASHVRLNEPAPKQVRDMDSLGLSASDRALFQLYRDVSSEQDGTRLVFHAGGDGTGSQPVFEYWQDSWRSYLLQFVDTVRKNSCAVHLLAFAERIHSCSLAVARGRGDEAVAGLFAWLRSR